jgi:hypothetical protein
MTRLPKSNVEWRQQRQPRHRVIKLRV